MRPGEHGPELFGEPTQADIDAVNAYLGDAFAGEVVFWCDHYDQGPGRNDPIRCLAEVVVHTREREYNMATFGIARAMMLARGWTVRGNRDYCPDHKEMT